MVPSVAGSPTPIPSASAILSDVEYLEPPPAVDELASVGLTVAQVVETWFIQTVAPGAVLPGFEDMLPWLTQYWISTESMPAKR
jgi:hypothetical protein